MQSQQAGFLPRAVGLTFMDRYCTPEQCNDCPAKIVCRCLRVTEAEVIYVAVNEKGEKVPIDKKDF